MERIERVYWGRVMDGEAMVEPSHEDDLVLMEDRSGWTFLSNHAHVLLCISQNPDTRIRDIAVDVGITQRAVARILKELEKAGVVDRERNGRRNHYRVRLTSPLRHALERHVTVGELLHALSSEDPPETS